MSVAVSARADTGLSGRWLFISVLVHGVLGLFILALPVTRQLPPPLPDSVNVEIVPQPPPAEAQDQPAQPASLPPPAEQPPEILGETPPGMIRPTRMLSQEVLADPRSQETREIIRQLPFDERIRQLCGVEAMAQVGAWKTALQPDSIVVYAFAAPRLSQNAFLADGAAVHIGKEWYNLEFRCDLTPDHTQVAGFSFRLGNPIPKAQWEDHSLPDIGPKLH